MGSEALPKLLYVTSRGHSGSTLTELMIGAHSAVVPLGEIRQLGTEREEPCRCGGGPLPGCPFWKGVDDRLRGATGLGLGDLRLSDPDDQTFIAHNRAFVRACLDESGAEWAVDASKTLDRLQRLHDLAVFDLRILDLSRSPFGVIQSNVKRGRPWRQHARRYTVGAMHARRFFAQPGPAATRTELRYERLVAEPERELGRVLAGLGLHFEPGQLEWATQDTHTFAGNKMRMTRDSTLRLDDSWHKGLSLGQKLGVFWWTLPIRFDGTAFFDAHRPYWKGEGVAAWRAFRRTQRRKRWKKRPWIAGPYRAAKRILARHPD